MGQILENINKNLNKLNDVYDNEEKDYQVKHYAIFFNHGTIMQVDAMSYEWDDDVITFYDTPEDENIGNKVATFKTDVIYGSYDYLEDIDKEKYQIFVLHGSTRTYHRNKRIQKKWRKRYHYTQFLLVDKEEFNSLGLDFDGDICTITYKEENNGI